MSAVQTLAVFVSERWTILLISALVLASAVLVPKAVDMLKISRIPIVAFDMGNEEKRRQAYLTSARKLYNEGYRKFKDGVFRITTSRKAEILVLSPKFLPELKKLPDSIVSMSAAVDETMESKYTKLNTVVPIVPHAVKADLTPALTRLNPTLAEEVQEALDLELRPTKDWKEVDIHHVLVRVVAMASGRVFIGPELCRSEQYLESSINYTMDVMSAQKAVQQMKPWLRPFLANTLPEVKRLAQRSKEAEAFLNPLVEKRKMAAKNPNYEKPDDLIEWLLARQHNFPDKVSQNLAEVQLGVSFAAIHTTTLTATNAFYDVAALPDFATELREEADAALAENGGIFTSNALQSMKKMDSFLKETLRLHPATMASFQRKVLQPFTLSNGQFIPAGVTIEIPAVAVNSDSEIFADADRFDPLRFYRLRQSAKQAGSVEGAALNQFVSVSQNSLTFGYGRHACPGRFFAANEIKMILANALKKYEFKLAGGATERYPNLEFAHMCIPDMNRKLAYRSIPA